MDGGEDSGLDVLEGRKEGKEETGHGFGTGLECEWGNLGKGRGGKGRIVVKGKYANKKQTPSP